MLCGARLVHASLYIFWAIVTCACTDRAWYTFTMRLLYILQLVRNALYIYSGICWVFSFVHHFKLSGYSGCTIMLLWFCSYVWDLQLWWSHIDCGDCVEAKYVTFSTVGGIYCAYCASNILIYIYIFYSLYIYDAVVWCCYNLFTVVAGTVDVVVTVRALLIIVILFYAGLGGTYSTKYYYLHYFFYLLTLILLCDYRDYYYLHLPTTDTSMYKGCLAAGVTSAASARQPCQTVPQHPQPSPAACPKGP